MFNDSRFKTMEAKIAELEGRLKEVEDREERPHEFVPSVDVFSIRDYLWPFYGGAKEPIAVKYETAFEMLAEKIGFRFGVEKGTDAKAVLQPIQKPKRKR